MDEINVLKIHEKALNSGPNKRKKRNIEKVSKSGEHLHWRRPEEVELKHRPQY